MAVYKPQIKTENGMVDLDIQAEMALKDGNGDTISTTYVKSVNNTTPDANGNVNVSSGGTSLGYFDYIVGNKKINRTLSLKLDSNLTGGWRIFNATSGSNKASWLISNNVFSSILPLSASNKPNCACNIETASISEITGWTSFLTGDNYSLPFFAYSDDYYLLVVLPRNLVENNTITNLTTALQWLDNNPVYVALTKKVSNITIENI